MARLTTIKPLVQSHDPHQPEGRRSMSCRCKSYNRPDPRADVPEIVVTMPSHLAGKMGRAPGATTVCLDLCIAPAVIALWAKGIPTLSSCCGHNVERRTIIVDRDHRTEARAILALMNDPVCVGAWEDGELIWSEPLIT